MVTSWTSAPGPGASSECRSQSWKKVLPRAQHATHMRGQQLTGATLPWAPLDVGICEPPTTTHPISAKDLANDFG